MGTKERGEQIGVVISLSELGYPKPTWDDAKTLAATLNREAAFVVLAQANLFLAVASIQAYQKGDLTIRRFAQERLIANFISEKRLEEIKEKVGNSDLIDRILVHRSLAMAALRLVAMHAQVEGGNKLEKRADYDVLGELALIINSVTEPDARHLSACDIAAQISPSRERVGEPSRPRAHACQDGADAWSAPSAPGEKRRDGFGGRKARTKRAPARGADRPLGR